MDRRTEIVEAARKSFTLFGYKATTMEQVAKLAKVGKGTIYTFFKNKDELFQEIVMQFIKEMKAEVENTIDPNESVIDNTHHVLMKILEFREVHKLYSKLIEEERSMSTPEVHEMIKQIENELLNYLEDKIKIAVQRDEVLPCDERLVAYLLFKAYLAVVVDWSDHHDEDLTEKQIINLFQSTIFKGLMK